jgi:predicted nucleic acid-binding Zn ribbon protein
MISSRRCGMPFTPLKKVLESIMQQRDYTDDIEAYRIFGQWDGIVGTRLAAHTKPVRVSGSVLYVEVDDHLWFAQLKYMKGDLLRKIERAIKAGVFSDLKFLLKGV